MNCFWRQCSNRNRCIAFGSCVARYQRDHKEELFSLSEGKAEASPNARSADYQQGWDDCLDRVFRVLGEKFTRRV